MIFNSLLFQLTKAISVQEQNQKLKDQVRIKNKTIKDFKEKEKESQRKLHQLQSENQSLNQKLHENSQITESAKQENENLKVRYFIVSTDNEVTLILFLLQRLAKFAKHISKM